MSTLPLTFSQKLLCKKSHRSKCLFVLCKRLCKRICIDYFATVRIETHKLGRGGVTKSLTQRHNSQTHLEQFSFYDLLFISPSNTRLTLFDEWMLWTNRFIASSIFKDCAQNPSSLLSKPRQRNIKIQALSTISNTRTNPVCRTSANSQSYCFRSTEGRVVFWFPVESRHNLSARVMEYTYKGMFWHW